MVLTADFRKTRKPPVRKSTELIYSKITVRGLRLSDDRQNR